MARRKRRIRSPHPGVKLKSRTLASGRVRWFARYVDPDTGRETDCTLDLLALPTREARTLWAKHKAKELARRRMEIAAGAPPPAEPLSLESAVKDYLDAATVRLRPATVSSYRQSLSRMLRWAKRAGVANTTDLGTPELAKLRDALIRQPKAGVAKGGRRGARKSLSVKRAVPSVNCDLRAIKAMLGDLRKRKLLPGLHRDDIADALAALPVAREEPEFLAPSALRKLLAAAMRHDAQTFLETRDEHAGRRPRGSTPKYTPIAPFVAFLLLTGCRRGEALGLRWDAVDLAAVDHEGREVGEIRLRASGTKTHRARTIGLEVSPALRKLLANMHLQSGGKGAVFGSPAAYNADRVNAARKRLIRDYGAPRFTWQVLRSTCGTYLTNAPGIFGAATVFLSAKQLGHSVAVAEKHYLGVHRGIPRDARTLEAAMQIEGELAKLVAPPTTLVGVVGDG